MPNPSSSQASVTNSLFVGAGKIASFHTLHKKYSFKNCDKMHNKVLGGLSSL